MNVRSLFQLAAVLFLTFNLKIDFALADQTPARKPNVVFFLVDDLGGTDLGCFGSTFYQTVNIDMLAASGMKFTHAYAACPVCSPTRAGILTGKYPQRTEITDYINPKGANQPANWKRPTALLPAPYADRLALDEVTIAEAFKEAGYATFFAGKWHLGPEGFYPEDQGFDVNRGGVEQGGPYGGKKYFSPYDNPRLADGPEGEHLPDRLASEAVSFIEAHAKKPFFVYLSFYSVHTPLMARDDLKEKYTKKAAELDTLGPEWGRERERQVRLVQNHAVYAAMVEAMDLAVGKVLDALHQLHLEGDTIVVFTSDNGGLSTSEGHPTSNLPLRAGKGWVYEGGIRVPLILRVPGVTKPASVCKAPVTSPDFYPTLLELAGLPLRPDQHVDGSSFKPLLEGKESARPPLFWHYPHYGNQGGAPAAAVRSGNWKLIHWYEDDALELFNLRKDPSEKCNLADAMPQKRDELLAELDRWRRQVGAVLPKRP